MANRFRDFDAFFSEQKREPVKLKLFGEIHLLPPSVPASVIFSILRLQEKGEEEVPPEEIMKIASSLFGKEKLNSWMDKGLDIEQLSQLIQWAMEVYSGAEITGKEGNVATEKKTKSSPRKVKKA